MRHCHLSDQGREVVVMRVIMHNAGSGEIFREGGGAVWGGAHVEEEGMEAPTMRGPRTAPTSMGGAKGMHLRWRKGRSGLGSFSQYPLVSLFILFRNFPLPLRKGAFTDGLGVFWYGALFCF